MEGIRKKIRYKITAALLALSLFFTLGLTACSSDGGGIGGSGFRLATALTENQLFRIGKEYCTKAEAMVFLTTQKNMYEASYGSEIWAVPLEGKTFEDYILQSLQDFLAKMKCMVLMAEDYQITVTEEENQKITHAAEEYMNRLNQEDITYMNLTQDDARKAFYDYYLANKVSDTLTEEVNVEISDNEARVIHIDQILFKTYSLDGSGNRIEMDEADKALKLEQAQQTLEKIQAGEDFMTLAESKNEGNSISYTIKRGETPAAFEEAVFKLVDDEVSGIIETEYGYHIVRCTEDYDVEATEENKKELSDQQKTEAFAQLYDTFTADLVSQYNEEAWDSLSFQGQAVSDTADFFEIYEQYLISGQAVQS